MEVVYYSLGKSFLRMDPQLESFSSQGNVDTHSFLTQNFSNFCKVFLQKVATTFAHELSLNSAHTSTGPVRESK